VNAASPQPRRGPHGSSARDAERNQFGDAGDTGTSNLRAWTYRALEEVQRWAKLGVAVVPGTFGKKRFLLSESRRAQGPTERIREASVPSVGEKNTPVRRVLGLA
jgi:hypothetical protein